MAGIYLETKCYLVIVTPFVALKQCNKVCNIEIMYFAGIVRDSTTLQNKHRAPLGSNGLFLNCKKK
jgi:hypothetical protein